MGKILIICDNYTEYQNLLNFVSKDGLVFENISKEEFYFESIQLKNYELILTDIKIESTNDRSLIKKINDFAGEKKIPFIFTISNSDYQSLKFLLENGIADFIKKPFTEEEIINKIQIHISGSKAYNGADQTIKTLRNNIQILIEEIEIAKEKLDKASMDLSKLDKAQTGFLSLISHEIRTPLNSISGFIYLLKKQNKVSGIEKYLNPLDQSVQRLENFSTKALLLTEISSYGIDEFPMQEINISELILFALNNLAQKIDKKKVKIKTDNLAENIIIKGDEDFFLKSFEYVIENAVNYSDSNGIVEINSIKLEKEIIFEIIDSGPGFPEEILNNLQQLLYPEKHTGQKFGLSLAFVVKVMEKFGGYISIENMKIGSNVSLHFSI